MAPAKTQPGSYGRERSPSGLASLQQIRQGRALDGNTVALDQQLTKVADTETTQSLSDDDLEEIRGNVQYGFGQSG